MQSQIDIGEKAPEIQAKCYFPKDADIKDYKLSDDKGKWVVLTFYPGDFTFVCATDVEAFTEKYDDFAKNGAVIYGISTDSIFSHKEWAETSPRVKQSKIPLIEDFNKRISEAYGFLNKETGAARRGTVRCSTYRYTTTVWERTRSTYTQLSWRSST
ncbi:redoxin domain-containing protein [Candidatus Marsarchaeota archaeon]|nr:redoxin domain-containing protein [Candidatus Marsarchaeota archaeon]